MISAAFCDGIPPLPESKEHRKRISNKKVLEIFRDEAHVSDCDPVIDTVETRRDCKSVENYLLVNSDSNQCIDIG